MILTTDNISSLDLEALSTIDEEVVEVGGQLVTLTALVPADVEKARKLVLSKKLDEELVMEYMTFLAMKKAHPEVTWYKFQKMNFKTVNKLMATMAVMNGFTEAFQVFGDRDRTSSGIAGSEIGDPDELDFD